MDTAFFQKFLTLDDIDKLSAMPEQAAQELKTLFESAPGIGASNGSGFGEMRALLHYHKGYAHIFIRELDMSSGDFECCLVDSSGCPELRHANFRELVELGFHFDFDWNPDTSFGSAMFYKVPEPVEKIEIPEWYSYASADYWRGMATLREMLGKRANTIYLNYISGMAWCWEEMEADDDIPAYVPDDLLAGGEWNFELEIRRRHNLVYDLVVCPHMECLALSIRSRAKKPDLPTFGRPECKKVCELGRKDFVSPPGLARHAPKIIERIKAILKKGARPVCIKKDI